MQYFFAASTHAQIAVYSCSFPVPARGGGVRLLIFIVVMPDSGSCTWDDAGDDFDGA